MSRREWIKLHLSLRVHAKYIGLTRPARSAYFELLMLAGANTSKQTYGLLASGEAVYSDKQIAEQLAVRPHQWLRWKEEMIAANLISQTEGGALAIHDFEEKTSDNLRVHTGTSHSPNGSGQDARRNASEPIRHRFGTDSAPDRHQIGTRSAPDRSGRGLSGNGLGRSPPSIDLDKIRSEEEEEECTGLVGSPGVDGLTPPPPPGKNPGVVGTLPSQKVKPGDWLGLAAMFKAVTGSSNETEWLAAKLEECAGERRIRGSAIEARLSEARRYEKPWDFIRRLFPNGDAESARHARPARRPDGTLIVYDDGCIYDGACRDDPPTVISVWDPRHPRYRVPPPPPTAEQIRKSLEARHTMRLAETP